MPRPRSRVPAVKPTGASGCPFAAAAPPNAGGTEARTASDLARLAAIVESSDDAIISKDLDGTIRSWNRGAQRLFGYAPGEIIGRPVTLLIPPDHLDEEAEILSRVRRGERVDHYQTTRITKDGRSVEVFLTVSPMLNEAGRIVGASTIVRDITAYGRMETELGQDRLRLQAILDAAIDAIITIDGQGLIQFVNPATSRMFGYAADELIGRNVNILMPAPYRDEHDSYLARHVRTGERRIIGLGREVRGRRKDGTEFPVDLAVSEVEPRKLFTGIIRDISDRKLAETRMRESDRMASIGTLAAGLGHDMNNVLLPVRARLNALHTDGEAGKLPAADRKHVEEVRKSVAYLQQLADGLHFLAMDPDREDPTGGVTNLREWWSQAGPLLSKAVPKHVKVTAVFSPDLPDVAVAAHGLTQAVLNLVVNAGGAIPTETKRRQGHVRLSAKVGENAGTNSLIKLCVTDNGTGMSEEVRRRAFELFFTTKPRGLGTGLGLALVRKVAEIVGGSVNIESQLGRGTTVTMNLPIVPPVPAVDRPLAAISVGDGRAAGLMRHLLEAAGADVQVRTTPGDADIWIVDPMSADPRQARAWRTLRPRGKVVLFGRPPSGPQSSKQWSKLAPLIIEDPTDFETVREVLLRAVTVE